MTQHESIPTPLHSSGGSTPIPDPTVLTSMLVDKAIAGLREIMEAEIHGNHATLVTRLDGMDKAIALHQVQFDRLPASTDEKVAQLRAINEERFRAIDQQFIERDTRVKESATATATAVAAALQAAKEAVGEQNKSFTVSIDKSEKATGEQISQQRVQIETMAKGIDGKIDDIKDRVTRIESIGAGRSAEVGDRRSGAVDNRGNTTLLVGIGLAILALIEFLSRGKLG